MPLDATCKLMAPYADRTAPGPMAPETPEDEERRTSAAIVADIVAGAAGGVEALIARYRNGLVFRLRRSLRDPARAEDIAHDALMLVIDKLQTAGIQDPTRLAGYIHGVAKNLSLAEARKAARRQTHSESEFDDFSLDRIDTGTNPDDPSTMVERDQTKDTVRQLLDELNEPRDRQVLIRTYVLEQRRDVICRDLGIDAQHLSRVLYRAKQRFRALLTSSGAGAGLRLVDD